MLCVVRILRGTVADRCRHVPAVVRAVSGSGVAAVGFAIGASANIVRFDVECRLCISRLATIGSRWHHEGNADRHT